MKMTASSWMIFLALALTACQPAAGTQSAEVITVAGGSYRNISADGLHRMREDKDFVFVNVHIPYEGDIPGTDLSIPYDRITEPTQLALLPPDTDAKIVLYCRSGRMSQIAAEKLVLLGYTNLWNLEGGMLGWEQAGYPLEGN